MSKLLLAASVLLLATPALAFSVDAESTDQPIRINPVYSVALADGSSGEVVQLPSSVSFHLSAVQDPIAHADLAAASHDGVGSGYDPTFEPTRDVGLPQPGTLAVEPNPEQLVLSGSGVDPNVLAGQLR